MNRKLRAIPASPRMRESVHPHGPIPILICVPALAIARRRRRLRREVRIVGSALLLGLPLMAVALLICAGRSPVVAETFSPAPPEAAEGPHGVALSIEPVSSEPPREMRASAVLRGYILPADGWEGIGHAGS